MSENARLEKHGSDAEVAKQSHSPLGDAADQAPSARGQSAELRGVVQRKGNGPASAEAGADVTQSVAAATSGGGGPLPFRAEMEKAFGEDFSSVRVHTGASAAQANAGMGAAAFATGETIVLKDPNPSKELIAHELTHVVQQRQGRVAPGVQHKLTVGAAGDSFEQEADRTAAAVVGGKSVDAAGLSAAPGGRVSRQATPLPKKFDKIWDAHPHNYQSDDSQNTSSAQVQENAGWDPSTYGNTCAIRMSVMWNKLGGEYKITKEKGAQAGLAPGRVVYSKKQDWYYILSAKEMWTYVSFHFGKPHKSFPGDRRFKDQTEFEKSLEKDIMPYVKSRQGIVAFDKIFGYTGSGHVDVFNGEKLSDSPTWYASQQVKLWLIAPA